MPLPPVIAKHTTVIREFVTYGICGVGALTVFLLTTWLCQLIAPEHVASSLPDNVRARNLVDFQIIAFFPSNLFAWWSNRTFAFEGRRHSLRREISLFFGIAALSFVLSLAVPILLVRHLGVPNAVANISLAILSACWNFILRRIFVFGTRYESPANSS